MLRDNIESKHIQARDTGKLHAMKFLLMLLDFATPYAPMIRHLTPRVGRTKSTHHLMHASNNLLAYNHTDVSI
jgi:hypothetical protein